MAKFMTVQKSLILARGLLKEDFVVGPWHNDTAEEAYQNRKMSAWVQLTLKQEAFDNLVEVWNEAGGGRLWQDWSLDPKSDRSWYKNVVLGVQLNDKIDFRGCKSEAAKRRKAQASYDKIQNQIKTMAETLIAAEIQKFNEKVSRIVTDRNRLTLLSIVDHCLNISSYPKFTEKVPAWQKNADRIDELQKEIKALQLENRRLANEFLVESWSGDSKEWPESVKDSVLAKAKENLAKIASGEIPYGRNEFFAA